MSPDKGYVRDTPQQGLKPNSLLIFYGPTKVVPWYKASQPWLPDVRRG